METIRQSILKIIYAIVKKCDNARNKNCFNNILASLVTIVFTFVYFFIDPSKSWGVLGTDLFEFEGHQWLIIADYYTKYPIIRQLPNLSPSSVLVNVTKQIFAEFGILDRIVSDNGPSTQI